jgi:D-threonate/D-erythronate kinase
MPRVLVVADDLTGANATAARFARSGMASVSLVTSDLLGQVASDHQVVATSTSSRHLAPEEAARRVAETIAIFAPVPMIVKRTDSTLRGNIGREIEAALQEVRRHHPGARAIFVPSFPEAGRITLGGVQLVDGVPLTQSAAAEDRLTPVTSDRVADVVRLETDLAVAEVHLDVVRDAEEVLLQALAAGGSSLVGLEGKAGAVDVLVVDSADRRDLIAIANAAARCAENGAHWLVVDPGPFGPELAMALGLSTRTPEEEVEEAAAAVGGGTGPGRRGQRDLDDARTTGRLGGSPPRQPARCRRHLAR